MDIKKNLFIKYLQYINGLHSSNTPTNHLAIEAVKILTNIDNEEWREE
jgi:hypothetical protein